MEVVMRLIFLSCLPIMLIAACPAYASNPCQTLLCMAGEVLGQSGGGACDNPIADYFNIIGTKRGKFNPGRTFTARLNFLNSCPGVLEGWPMQINAVYGYAFGL
jgi:hypothetical protein